MKAKVFVLWGLLLTVMAFPVLADTDGLGVPDTVDMVFPVVPDAATNEMDFQVEVWVFNDSNDVGGASAGWLWLNPNLVLDSAVATPLTLNGFEIGPFYYENDDINLSNANDRFVFAGSRMFGPGITFDDSRRLWCNYYFHLTDWNPGDSIVIDTSAFGSSSVYKFVGGQGVGDYFPYWTGRKVIRDTSFVAPMNLIVNPDTLYFEAVEGGSSPTLQPFTVASDGDPIDFNLVETADWFAVSPTQGTTFQTINVLPNTFGLSEGTYLDSVMVASGEADNSPQFVYIHASIAPPPPIISVDPEVFYFNAVAGGANPAPKTMTIENAGGSTLEWTLTNGESWLTLDQYSGTGMAVVTLSVDITGLAFDDYVDTVVVSDPDAENDPVYVPVYLSIGSDLPIIEVDPALHNIIVPVPTTTITPRTFQVLNGGAGAMSFSLTEDSPRIQSLTPVSGTAPQEVTVTFKPSAGSVGNDYYDTVWVSSNEAIESPVPVVFFFHYLEDPAMMNVNLDTLRLSVYECDQGYFGIMPSRGFLVSNLGGDDPMPVILTYESDLFRVNKDSANAPAAFTVTALDLDLPFGDYYDTITVSAWNAMNSPIDMIIKYAVVEGTETPQIYLTKDEYVIPTQENSGPTPPASLDIFNRYGGCMPWELVEDIPWLYPNIISGDVPGATAIGCNSAGFPFGQYLDTLYIVAPTASNTPAPVEVQMLVWRFHGDNDYDGEISIADLVYMVEYMFEEGPGPQPQRVVGDMNCNLFIDIEDLVYLVDYMFYNGPIPCGNPY